MKNVICLTGFGDYRKGVLTKIFDKSEFIEIISGNEAFESSVRLISENDFSEIRFVKNIFLFNRKLMYQSQSLKTCLSADQLIIDLNPRVINVWIVLILRCLIRKKTNTWGHAWPRNNKDGFLRWCLKKMSDSIIVYTETQKNEVLQKYPKMKVISAPNSLYSKSEIIDNMKYLLSDPINIIHVGRLVASKKVELLIEAFILIKNKLPKGVKLILVGDGDQKTNLENRVKELGLEDLVLFTGHVTDPIKLREYYTSSLISISAGYVGLSITQSFSFGVPMLISKNEPHSPEIEAAIENVNARFFESDSINDLSEKILEFYSEKSFWLSNRNEIIGSCAQKYSTDQMSQRILSCFKG